jgi:alpha-1,6-mannosyltransferase
MVPAVVMLGWSPLLLWEIGGNGHNDSVMAFFLAAALLAAARRAYLWLLPLLVLSALVKYTTALAIPVALVWLLRRPDVSGRTIALGAGIAVLCAVVAFAPLAAGTETVAALRRPGMTFILSPGTLVHGWLAGRLTEAEAANVVRAATGLLFLGTYIWVVARSGGDARDLAARCFDVLVLYLLLASWWFFPWYVLWLAPPAVLARGVTRLLALAAMSGAALLTYCYWWPDPPFRSEKWFRLYAAIVAGVFVLPAAIWLWGLIREASHGHEKGLPMRTEHPAAT